MNLEKAAVTKEVREESLFESALSLGKSIGSQHFHKLTIAFTINKHDSVFMTIMMLMNGDHQAHCDKQ